MNVDDVPPSGNNAGDKRARFFSFFFLIVILIVFFVWQAISIAQQKETAIPILVFGLMLMLGLLLHALRGEIQSKSLFYNVICAISPCKHESQIVWSIVLAISLLIHVLYYNNIVARLTARPIVETPIELLKKDAVSKAKLIEGGEYVRYDELTPEMRILVSDIGGIRECRLFVGLEGHTKGDNCSSWCTVMGDTIIIIPDRKLSPEIHYAWLEVLGPQEQTGYGKWAFMPTIFIDFTEHAEEFKQDPPEKWSFVSNEAIGEIHNRLVLPAFLKLCEDWQLDRIVVETDCYFEKSKDPRPGGIGFYLPGGYSCIFRDGSAEKVTIKRWGYGRKSESTGEFSPEFQGGYRYILKVKKTDGDIECFVWDNRVARWHDYHPLEGDPGVAIGVWNTKGHFRWVRIYCPTTWEH